MEGFLQLDKKRRIYFAACLAAVFVVGLNYSWSVLQIPFIKHFGGDSVRSSVVFCYTIGLVMSTVMPVIFSPLFKRLGPKKSIFLGALIAGTGYIAGGNTDSLVLFYIFFGVFKGLGSGFIYVNTMNFASHMFPDKRGAASGAVAGVFGGASMLWSPLMASMIEHVSLSFACAAAGCTALIVIGLVSFIIQVLPEDYLNHKSADAMAAHSHVGETAFEVPRSRLLHCRFFYIAFLAYALGACSGQLTLTQTSSIMQQSFLLTATRASFYASVMSLTNMIGRFFWGSVSDRFDKCSILCLLCIVPAFTMVTAAIAGGQAVTTACLAVTAFCYGGIGGTVNSVTAFFFGKKDLSANYAVMNMSFSIAAFLAPQMAVALSSNGDFTMVYIGIAIVAAIASILAVLSGRIVRRGILV